MGGRSEVRAKGPSTTCRTAVSASLAAVGADQSQQGFQMSRLLASGGQSIGASASATVRPMNVQS